MSRVPGPPALFVVAAVALLAGGGCSDKMVDVVDPNPPEVMIVSPDDQSDVSGVAVWVEVNATDDVGVDRVEFRVNGGPAFAVTQPPYRALGVTLTTAEGTQAVVSAEAFDAAGNSATDAISVTVSPRTTTRLTNEPNDDMYPEWSPDGTRIVFQAKRTTGRFDLWTMNADGSAQTRLTTNSNDDRFPAWSPDGAWIAFDSNRGGKFDLYALPYPQGEAGTTQLTMGNLDNVQPEWSPDGSELYFSSDRGSSGWFNIWKASSSGTEVGVSQVTAYNAVDVYPVVAPRNDFLAFVTDLNFASPKIYGGPIGSTQVFTLTGETGFVESEPEWSPDGQMVIFTRSSGAGQNTRLWIVPTDTQTPEQVTFTSSPIGDGGAVWSPDGSRIAFHSDRDGNLEIYVME